MKGERRRARAIVPSATHVAILAAVVAAATSTAFADERTDAAFSVAPARAATLDDAQLRDLRGKFVPASAGSIVYFGLDLSTAWTTATNASDPTTYSVGAQLGIDLSGGVPKVTLATSSSRSGPSGATGASGGADPSAGGVVLGTPADGRTAGLTQSIQIAGNGNAVQNRATLDVSRVRPVFVVTSTGNACGSACTTTVDASGIRLGIALPGGSAAQSLGSNGVTQGAQIVSNANSVTNALGIALQVGHASAAALQAGSARLFAPIPTSGLR